MENKKETLFIVIIILLVISTVAFAYAWYRADKKEKPIEVEEELLEEEREKETVEEVEEEKEEETEKDEANQTTAPKPVKSYDAKGVKPKGTETLPFTVMVNSADGELNVREAPNNNARINKVVNNGEVFTVVEFSENKAWGKLKSGSGWIYLGLTKLFTVKN